MTDAEIIKALKLHAIEKAQCMECPYVAYEQCSCDVASDALGLINRLQIEIDSLKDCPKCIYESTEEVTVYCSQSPCPNFKENKKMKFFSLFSGIGAFEKALKNLGVDFELVGYCEIDKYASKSYSAIHDVPESMNYGDITKIDESTLPNDIDLITYGFPCQDISLAGKQKGLFNEDGSQTRSGLFFEALRIIEETQPRVAIAENVKNLTSKKFAV